jgi:hypothetical protein
MHLTATHRIKSVIFNLKNPDTATAFSIRNKLENLFYSDGIPALEQALDSCFADDDLYRIDHVEVDLGCINPNDLDRQFFRQSIIERLRHQIGSLSTDSVTKKSYLASLELMLFQFLDSGMVPWESSYDRPEELEAAILSLDSSSFNRVINQMLPHLHRHRLRLRLIYQFSTSFIESIIKVIDPVASPKLFQICRKTLKNLSSASFREILLNSALDASTNQYRSIQDLNRCVFNQQQLHIHPKSRVQTEFDRDDTIQIHKEFDTRDLLYVRFAGVVLLHPFLQQFFHRLGLINNAHQFKSNSFRSRTVHLLHYLATGKENPPEHETILFKIMCGYPIRVPLAKELSLSKREKDESRDLLKSVLKHWTKLKNTSMAGLRETFLQREGKLITSNSGFHLVVERRTVDVLLDHLPWTLSVLKFPWLASPLHIDWC